MMETVVADFKDTVLGILNVYYSSIIRQAENVMPTMICLIFVMRTLQSPWSQCRPKIIWKIINEDIYKVYYLLR